MTSLSDMGPRFRRSQEAARHSSLASCLLQTARSVRLTIRDMKMVIYHDMQRQRRETLTEKEEMTLLELENFAHNLDARRRRLMKRRTLQ